MLDFALIAFKYAAAAGAFEAVLLIDFFDVTFIDDFHGVHPRDLI